MAIVHFASLNDCDLIEVEFVTSHGRRFPARLLVDSGFTGSSCFVLPESIPDLALANLSSAYATGALTGSQQRAIVRCSIPALSYERSVAAIIADLRSLSLPPGVGGMVGLAFLRQFKSWGAERNKQGKWEFFLATE